jgi:hypothetical protein
MLISTTMNILNLEGTEDTPRILLDKGNGIFELSGRSLPEDAAEFYSPVFEWLDGYSASPNAKTDFVFKLEYFNTASSKIILDILSRLEDIAGTTIHWYYHEEDEDMQEAGEEFSELVELTFEMKTY